MARSRRLTPTQKLQQEAIAMRKRLTSKTYRIKNTTGVDIAGTGLDIRKPAAEVRKMNASQLRSYLRQGEAFVKQKVELVGNGSIPRTAWQQYQVVERRFNREAKKRLEAYKDVVLPGDMESIGERAKKRVTNMRMDQESINRPMEPVKRNVEHIRDLRSLELLRQDLERRMKPEFYSTALEQSRETAIKSLIKMGMDQDTINWVDQMPDDAWDMLWNYGNFANSLFSRYDSLMKQAANIQVDRGYKAIGEEAENDIRDTILWARTFIEQRKAES